MDTAHDLAARLADLLRREHVAMAEFLVALAEFDARRLWERLGHANLFTFLHRDLGLSKGAAHYRKVAAELVQRYPEIVEPLRDGRLCFSSVLEVAKVITPENRAEILPRFFHRSRREAMEVAAELRPAETVPLRDVVTAVRPRTGDGRALQLASLSLPRPREAGERVGVRGPEAPPPNEIIAQPVRTTMGEVPQFPVHLDELPRSRAPRLGPRPSAKQ